MPVALGETLLGGWLRRRAASAAVKAHAGDARILRHGLAVRGTDDVHVDVGYRRVVIEGPAIPVASRVSDTEIAEAVVDTSVKADVRPPVAGVPDEDGACPSPIARRPQRADVGREHPGPRDPVIAIGTVGPVARYPDIFRTRTDRLHIHGKRRRRKRDRY